MTAVVREILKTWFSLSRPVGQRFYAASGFGLVAFNLFPQLYWNLWSDALIHRIHRRVLDHVKRRSEGRGVGPSYPDRAP